VRLPLFPQPALIPLLICSFGLLTPVAGSAQAAQKSVLAVYADERLLPANILVDEVIRHELAVGTEGGPVYYSEFLDVVRFPGEQADRRLARFLSDKYSDRSIDVIIAPGPLALDFVLRHRDWLFSSIPVVYCAMGVAEVARLSPPPDVVGVPADFDPRATLELALRLQPRARELIGVTGTAAFDRTWEQELRKVLPSFQAQRKVRILAGLPMRDLLRELGRLSPDAIVFVGSVLRDGSGQTFTGRLSTMMIARASKAPTYGVYSTTIGWGVVGGRMPTFEEIGKQAGGIARRMLGGESPLDMRLPASVPTHYVFDWRQLQRWNIPEDALPAGSIVRFRTPTFWEDYRWHVVAVLAVLVAQALLIAALLVHRRRRRRAELELRESEERMGLAAGAANLGMWTWEVVRDEIWSTDQGRALFGFESGERLDFRRFLKAVHLEDREAVRRAMEAALGGSGKLEVEYRLDLPAGRVRWIGSRGRVEFDDRGQPMRMRGAAIDITARKRAELEAEQSRREAAHLMRVAMLGELSGALTHELNQPLAAILTNAQAAQRFLAADGVDLSEIHDILKDIVADDERAGDVIRRLRGLYRKDQPEFQPVAVAGLVHAAIDLMRTDLNLRGVGLEVELETGLPPVHGDRVQLGQVLLNLMLNGAEAMVECPPGTRNLLLAARLAGPGMVQVSIRDRGPGIAASDLPRLFEPFYSTKTDGLGLGLSICRTIVTAHGGRLWAENNADRGATFHVRLPIMSMSKLS
jgi:signal transduction histidine kinase